MVNVFSVWPSYPAPPPMPFVVSPEADAMYYQFRGFKQGKVPLAAMAFFCSNCLNHFMEGPSKVASRLKVSEDVLRLLSDLSSQKGGKEARKGAGVAVEFS